MSWKKTCLEHFVKLATKYKTVTAMLADDLVDSFHVVNKNRDTLPLSLECDGSK